MRAPWRPESSAHLIGVWRGAWCAMVVDDAMSCFVMLAGDVHAAAAVRQTQWPEVRVPLNFYNAPLSGPPLSCAPISSPPPFSRRTSLRARRHTLFSSRGDDDAQPAIWH